MTGLIRMEVVLPLEFTVSGSNRSGKFNKGDVVLARPARYVKNAYTAHLEGKPYMECLTVPSINLRRL